MISVSGMHPRNRHLLNLAFVLLLGLFLMVVLLGFFQTWRLHADLQAIATERYNRTVLVFQLHNAARERSMALFTMTVVEDPFERDRAFQRFLKLGADFVRFRRQLLAMPLDPEERRLLEIQGRISAVTVPIQRRLAELAQEERTDEARTLLLQKAIPGQNRVLDTLQTLQDWQLDRIEGIREQARRAQQNGYLWLGGLSLLALVLGFRISQRVTQRIDRYENALYLEKELAEVTLASIGDAVITTDAEGRITLLNPLAESLTGWSLPEARERPIRQVLRLGDSEDQRAVPHPADNVLVEGRTFRDDGDLILRDRTGREYAVEITATPIRLPNGDLHGMVLVFRDVTEWRSLTDKLAYQARHDPLTGLINRAEFEARLEEALASARKQPRRHALLYLDLDQLKLVNDTAGHGAGDELLKQVAGRLSALLQPSDSLARLGGDEFGILLLDCNPDEARTRAEQFGEAIAETRFAWAKNTFEISASIGVVTIHRDSGELAGVISAADAACHLAKKRGRNRIEVYQEDNPDLDSYRGEIRWAPYLRQALQKERFVLHCQKITPLVDEERETLCELLIRLPDEQGNLIPPGAFLPAAERYNLMPQIDRWVVQQAVTLLRTAGSSAPIFTINLSGQSIGDERFIADVEATVLAADIDRHKLCFEVTETCAIANLSAAIRFMTRLREAGCRFALDDFGSGLSSFAYLKNLPVDYLKIDGSFIRDIGHDPIDRAFVESIQRIARMMDLQTIAEFVENAQILDGIRQIGIHYGQGFHLHSPTPVEVVLNMAVPA